MTDEELAEWLHCTVDMVKKMPPIYRKQMEDMKPWCDAVELYDKGLGPLPEGTIVCREHKHK